jgi:hypothetical protein
VVERWLDALNSRDVGGVLALSSPAIAIEGPRGAVTGTEVLRSWLESTNVALHSLRTFARGNVVVVTQRGVWIDPDSGAAMGESLVTSTFHVESGLVTRYARYEEVVDAFAAAGLTEADEL